MPRENAKRAACLTRREFLSRAGTFGAAVTVASLRHALSEDVFAAAGEKAGRKAPNIVYMMTDDQRFDAMSCAGNTIIQTPNMDRIAKEGVRFLNMFVTNSLCAPSRATFMTGKYSHVHGVRTNSVPFGPQPVFTDDLRKAGYHTCFIGKWHMSGAHPGFDYWLGFSGQGQYQDPPLLDFDGELKKEKGHVTDLLTDRAIKYIRQYRKEPFCLFLWFKSPHRDWQPAKRFESLYEDVEIPDPPAFNDDYSGRPDAIRRTEMQVEIAKPPKPFKEWLKDYYRVLAGVDENIGRLLNVLDELKLAEDTIVIFGSDNGFFLGEHHFFDKRLMYEPSIRVPMLIRYPRLIPKGGRTIAEMALNIDLAPTLLDLAGLKIPDDTQGKSWKPLLEGKRVPWRKSWYYEYFEYPAVHMVRPNRGVRTERWKYIEYPRFYLEREFRAKTQTFDHPAEYELYDLKNDPHEVKNLYADPSCAAIVEELRKEMARLRKETGDEG